MKYKIHALFVVALALSMVATMIGNDIQVVYAEEVLELEDKLEIKECITENEASAEDDNHEEGILYDSDIDDLNLGCEADAEITAEEVTPDGTEGDDGSIKEPIPIYTIEDLYAINENMSGDYILMNDIDMTDSVAQGGEYNFSGNGWKPIGGTYSSFTYTMFTGTFDGNNHTIYGMTIDIKNWTLPSSAYDNACLGLFAVNAGVVKNLCLKNGAISNTMIPSAYLRAGAVCGINNGTVTNCHNYIDISVCAALSGTVNRNTVSYISGMGGITGINGERSLIENCSNNGNICTNNTKSYVDLYGISYGMCYVGGISGINKGEIRYSYNAGAILQDYRAVKAVNIGGISTVGRGENFLPGLITNCYNAGRLESGDGIGGYENVNCYTLASDTKYSNDISWCTSNAIITNCYAESGCAKNQYGKWLSKEKLISSESYVGFDFDNVWFIDVNSHYPYPQLRSNPHDTSGYEHTYDTGTIIAIPTSDTTGLIRYKCTSCEMTYDDVLPTITFRLCGVNVVLSDAIGLNFYVEVPEKDYSFSAVLSQYENKYEVEMQRDIIEMTNEKCLYKITYKINAAEINDKIKIEIKNINGDFYSIATDDDRLYSEGYSLSVSDYLKQIIKDNQVVKDVTLAKALLDYGNCAQIYFDYHIDIAEDVSQDVNNVTLENIDNSRYNVSDSRNYYLGSSLLLRSKVTIRHYFIIDDYEDGEYVIYIDGETVEPKCSYGNIYYIEICDILPTQLDDYFSVVIEKNGEEILNLSYSADTYVYKALSKSTNHKLVTLAKALYRYSKAANDYVS